MMADSPEIQYQDNHMDSIEKDAGNLRASHAGLLQQSPNRGQRSRSLKSLPDVESLRISGPSSDASPTAHQKPIGSDITESKSSTLSLALDSTHSFDAVFRSLSAGDGHSDLSNNGNTDQRFEQALVASLRLAEDAMALCETIKEHDTVDKNTVETILQEAENLCTFIPESEKIIALLGRSGEGKTSLINSLLGFTDLAPTGDIGSACTSVVTEFRQTDGHHTSQITLEVEYYTTEETKELLADLVENFRKVHLTPTAQSTEEKEALPRDELHYENLSKEAWSALQAAFGNHELFGRSFLLDRSAGAFERITSQLHQWTQLLQWPDEAKEGKYSVSVDDEEECTAKMSSFMQDKFWPFTKIMRIFVDSNLLKSGIVLADLPGRSDTNTARTKAGQIYLQKCDCVFVLSNISRAVTDASLESSVYEMLAQEIPVEWEINRAKSLQVTVICTKTDEINIPANKRALIPTNSPDFKSCITELEKDLKRAVDEKSKKSSKTQMKSLLIKARNVDVESKLRRSYQLEDPTRQLSVYCVSSTMYDKWANKKDGADRMLELSGIPILRLFCRSLNRSDREAEILNFIQSRLLALLNTLDLCSNTITSRMDAQTAAEVWKDTQEKINYFVVKAEDRTKEQCLEAVATYFKRRVSSWERAAQQECRKWQTSLKWNQIDAFCRNYGDYETKMIKRTNWNRDIVWKMAQELTMPLEDMEEDVWKEVEGLLDDVQQEIADLKETYEEGGLPPAVLFGLNLHAIALVFKIQAAQKKLRRKLGVLRRSALEANRASCVVRNMMPAYLSAIQIYGDGKKRRQCHTLQHWIECRLFAAMKEEIKDGLSGLFESTFGDLRGELEYILGLLRNDVAAGLAAPDEYQQVALHADSVPSRVDKLLAGYGQIADQIGAPQ